MRDGAEVVFGAPKPGEGGDGGAGELGAGAPPPTCPWLQQPWSEVHLPPGLPEVGRTEPKRRMMVMEVFIVSRFVVDCSWWLTPRQYIGTRWRPTLNLANTDL